MPRYLVYGAGAIGGVIAARLSQAGADVTLLARGDNLAKLRSDGVTLMSPQGLASVPVPVIEHAADAALVEGDIVVLATKSQDTEAALLTLETAGVPADVAIACAQNGVDNERMVSRRGFPTYGMSVTVPAVHLEPGVVELQFGPVAGVIDVGCFPAGLDALAGQLAADLQHAEFAAHARKDVMRFKYAKLVGNVVNALEAMAGPAARTSALAAAAQDEARAVYAAAGIDVASDAEMTQATAALTSNDNISKPPSGGGSSWQSLTRKTGRIEADWLNGEIVLLGALHDVPVPVNQGLRRIANRMAREGTSAGSVPLEQIHLELEPGLAARQYRSARVTSDRTSSRG